MRDRVLAPPSIAVITVALNAARTIRGTIESIERQSVRPDEYIVVDGGSTDETVSIVRSRSETVTTLASEPDEGIFDAMNRGLSMAAADVVGFLNADDVFADSNVLARIRDALSDPDADACYGDLDMVDAKGCVVRRWRSGPFEPRLLNSGWVPPHPTFYCRRSVLLAAGGFRKNYAIAGDYELFLRLFALRQISARYLPTVMVRMGIGGTSNRSLVNILKGGREVTRAWRENGLRPPPFVALRKLATKGAQVFRTT